MSKLKNIILQLSDEDCDTIYNALMDSGADKSAYLLKFLKDKKFSDNQIMKELDVNPNAYYTLRSRLNEKIEEYLVEQMESPRTDLLKKIASIHEIIFTKKRPIAIATLKKLEKDLIEYDLSNELIFVYKTLKKLHINSEEHYHYSKLYNTHVAYTLAVDKAENILAEYFQKFGVYFISGDEMVKMQINYLKNEMGNVCKLYESHRLFIYQSCMLIFHRLFMESEEEMDYDAEPLEDIIAEAENIFDTYAKDPTYYHLRLVFEFLKLEYYTVHKVYRKAEKFYESVNDQVGLFLANYNLYTFPALFLLTKLDRQIRMDKTEELYETNNFLFQDFEADKNDVPNYIIYWIYRTIACFYNRKYDEASKNLNNLLNELSLKKYPRIQLEIKTLLVMQYCFMGDEDLFNQLMNSIQRQIRILGREECDHIINITKMLKVAMSDSYRSKESKIQAHLSKLKFDHVEHFTPFRYIKFNDDFIDKLKSR